MRKTFTVRIAVRFAVLATVLASLAVLAQPSDSNHGINPGAQTDVGSHRWGLSNPRNPEYVVRHLHPAPTPRPSSTAPGTPSATPTSTSAAPSATPSDTPSSSATPSDTPTSTVPTSETPTGTPTSDAPISTPTSDVSSSAAPTSDAPTSTDPTSSAPSTTDVGTPTVSATPTPTTASPTSVAPSTQTPTPSPTSSDPTINANLAMPAVDLPGWKLTYADDFNGTSLNKSAWSVYGNNTIPSEPDSGYWGTTHATVANSMLTLRGERDANLSPDGRIVTAGVGLWNLKPQTYGKYEALVRVDACPQVKYAWLLWPYSGKWPGDGEIDFAEDGGGDRGMTTGTVIYPDAWGNRAILPQERVRPVIPMSGWHVVGVEWTPGQVKYTMDGVVWGTSTSSHVPSGPMTMIMQTEAVTPANQVPSTFTSCNAQVGWVAQWAMR